MNLTELSTDCPGVDFTQPYMSFDTSFSIGDYVIEYLQKTFAIVKSSSTIKNASIVNFVRADIVDSNLPYTTEFLTENLRCSNAFADRYLRAQSSFFAVVFGPLEFKTLGPYDSVPFVVDPSRGLQSGGYGMVEKVLEGSNAFARKTLRDCYDTEKMMMELKILRLATETENPHLLRLRCAYKQDNRMCFVTYPLCDCDLRKFLDESDGMAFWVNLQAKDKLILITDWMACLASGLSALHRKRIKHQDMKPENVLLCKVGKAMMPVLCDFGLSKAFAKESTSVKVQGTFAYFPPEQAKGKVGRKGDVFSLGLIFAELGIFITGQGSLKQHIHSKLLSDIVTDLDNFLTSKFDRPGVPFIVDWCTRFRKLLRNMLDKDPASRPKASHVWEDCKEMVECLGAKPHCDYVSPVSSIPDEAEDDEDDEIKLNKDILSMCSIHN